MNALSDSECMLQVKCYGSNVRAVSSYVFGSRAAFLNFNLNFLPAFLLNFFLNFLPAFLLNFLLNFRVILLTDFRDRVSFTRLVVMHFYKYDKQYHYCQNDQDNTGSFNGFLYFSSFFLEFFQFIFLFFTGSQWGWFFLTQPLMTRKITTTALAGLSEDCDGLETKTMPGRLIY